MLTHPNSLQDATKYYVSVCSVLGAALKKKKTAAKKLLSLSTICANCAKKDS